MAEYKTRNMAVVLLLALFLQCIFPCLAAADAAGSLTVNCADNPQAVFAKGEIEAAAEKAALEGDWIVSLETIDETLGFEAYHIDVADNTITISGGDANGLMYGGFQVAEDITLYGIDGVRETQNTPSIAF